MSRKRYELDSFPVGHTYLATFPDEEDIPGWWLRLHFLSAQHMIIYARHDIERVALFTVRLAPRIYKLSWKECDGTTVVHIHDYALGIVHSDFTEPRSGIFTQHQGTLTLEEEVQETK